MVDQAVARQVGATRTVEVLGQEVALTDAGSGEPTVLLVHGIGMSGRYFRPLAEVLARTNRVVVPDLPGFGGSRRRRPPLTIEQHADVLTGVLKELDVVRPVLVGHSMGTQVVTEMAARDAGLADSLVLIGPVTEPAARSIPRQAVRLVRDAVRESPVVDGIMVSQWLRAGLRSYVGTLPAMRDYPLERRLAQVRSPVLLVRGSRDPVSPKRFLHALGAVAHRAGLAEVPGEAHVVVYRSPEAVARLITEPW